MSIYKRQDTGKWQVIVNDTELLGEQRPKKSFATFKEAQAWKHDVIERAKSGRWSSSNKATFAAITEDFITRTWARTTGRNADMDLLVARYYERYARAAVDRFGDKKIGAVTSFDMSEWIEALKPRYSASTVRQHYQVAKQIFEYALERDLIGHNPLTTKPCRLPAPRVRDKSEMPELEEVYCLLQFLEGPRPRGYRTWEGARALIPLLAFAGLRIGEAKGLDIEDIDFVRGEIAVTKQYTRDRRLKNSAKGRTGGPRVTRVVPMIPPLARNALEHIAWIKDRWHRDSGPYLTTLNGERAHHYWGPEALNSVQRACGMVDRDGNPKYTPHGFRHFAGSCWIHNGANIQDVSWWLGHSNVTTTSRIYVKQLHGRSQGKMLMDNLTRPLGPTLTLPLLPGPKRNENATDRG
jgi:integrase